MIGRMLSHSSNSKCYHFSTVNQLDIISRNAAVLEYRFGYARYCISLTACHVHVHWYMLGMTAEPKGLVRQWSEDVS